MRLSLAAHFFLLHLCNLVMGNAENSPRMIFTEKETKMKRFNLQDKAPVQILLEGQPDTVLAAGQTDLNTYNFQNSEKSQNHIVMRWKECNGEHSEQDCSYNITLVHPREDTNQLFVCGTNDRETVCCNTDLTESPLCTPSENMKSLREGISRFIIKKGEPSALVESEQSTDLYITNSGSQDNVGIHKFGKGRVQPSAHHKEQYYVGLVLSRRKEDPSQSRVYGFYKEKNKDRGLYSKLWLPFVTQVCMTDVGGPKNNLQFIWTSQMSARLFCGDPERGQYYSELVDVATVHAERWQDTKIYALFRNEWGMSAVCIYTIQDINKIFTNSLFKHYTRDQLDVPRMCAPDSTKIPVDILKMIDKTSEMEQSVQPVDDSDLLLLNHHDYTQIHVDGSPNKRSSSSTVIFLSLSNGRIHKVMHNKSHPFVIAEYQPFNYSAHILSFILHPSSKKLYVNTGNELVQLDVANCAQYGNTCEDCILSRDPYCGWNGAHCTPETNEIWHDAATGNLSVCEEHTAQVFASGIPNLDKNVISINLHAKHFLRCPVSSRHAQYSWHHLKNSTSCSWKTEHCLYLIDSMEPEVEGTHTCVLEEMGYKKVLVQYQLQLENKVMGCRSKPMIWVCLMVVLIKSLYY
ncbi:semaphorin-7A-like [Archocentrus centrarchus]|uniref:semaphorin-7A-like n=1 Tax=Archocentrus centrarchus TaxID=63155 RepID=UPI0011EA11F4|nr:semaphorin-7A-like [Archocentrus centrarchus]